MASRYFTAPFETFTQDEVQHREPVGWRGGAEGLAYNLIAEDGGQAIFWVDGGPLDLAAIRAAGAKDLGDDFDVLPARLDALGLSIRPTYRPKRAPN